ncbi:MAG: FtsX-like permease family protein [Bacteroidetes bacterium]|jgi:ABC-type lipoprotein release transport system permease subunit|nr:FtsX-like permease family protein [Bacteroidota bacterium]
MIIAISWRNVWRSKLRSAVILIAVALGIFAGVFTWAFYKGMANQRINSAIKTEASHIQIHHAQYLNDPDIDYHFNHVDHIKSVTDTMSGIAAVSTRIISSAMVMSAETGTGIQLIGIDPVQEKQVTDLFAKIDTGNYFQGNSRNPAVIGDDLAEKLNVDVRSKIVITLQRADGEITRAQFRIAGIFNTANGMYDETNVFVRQADMWSTMGYDDGVVHEMAILLKNNAYLDQVYTILENAFPDMDVKSWREIMPEVNLIEETMDVSMYIILIIILIALCFGIINTMLMAVLERVKELGMLMAVGMNKWRIFRMIMFETVFLSMTGGAVGIALAALISFYFGRTGINLSQFAEGYGQMGFDTMVYPEITLPIVGQVTIMVIITGIIGAIYPAIRALKLNPAEATRTDM